MRGHAKAWEGGPILFSNSKVHGMNEHENHISLLKSMC